ncbi:MAG: hypothetical protein O7A68_04340 [Alphaproteobacteria bacterium]|nr:hypothetical protein [Alphaproteobacteria bacterium]
MPRFVEDQLARIRDDRERGAAELAEAGLRLMARACSERAEAGREAMLGEAAELVRRLAALRPSMAPLGNWAAAFHAALRANLMDAGPMDADVPPADVPPAGACEAVLADLLARKAALSDALIAGAKPVLGRARGILTLSYSSTVEALLLEAAAPDCLVIVAESRPLLEGRKLCRSIEAAGRRVRCITDAQIGLALADADMALIGADAVLGDLAVVNKAGSLFAALAARAQGKPCHAAADTFKIDPLASSADAVFEEMAADEVWPERPEICANVYFEPVPAELIALYLTEKGPLAAARMHDEVAARRVQRRAAGLDPRDARPR